MTRIVNFEELSKETVIADNIECHRQIWHDGAEWLGYEKRPRQFDGLLLFNSDIVGEFYINGKRSFSAGNGDAVYIPSGSSYKLKFKQGGKATDIFTVNFTLSDAKGNILRMTDGTTLFPSAASLPCRNIASELSNAVLFADSKLKRQALLLSLLDSFSSNFSKAV